MLVEHCMVAYVSHDLYENLQYIVDIVFLLLNKNLSVCLSMYLSIYLSIYLSTYLSIYISTYVCMYVSIYLSTYLPTVLSRASTHTRASAHPPPPKFKSFVGFFFRVVCATAHHAKFLCSESEGIPRLPTSSLSFATELRLRGRALENKPIAIQVKYPW